MNLTPSSPDDAFPEAAEQESGRALAGEESWGCYVYGIVAAEHPSLPQTVVAIDPRWPVEMFWGGRVKALISRVPFAEFALQATDLRGSDLAWIETRLRAHDGVLKAAVQEGPLVPFRFGTLLCGEVPLANLLVEHQDRLIALLRTLADKSEWGMKLFHRPTPVGRAPEAFQPAAATRVKELRHGSGLSYLRQRQRRQQACNDARQAVWSAVHQCHESLSSAACGNVILPLHNHEPLQGAEEMLLNSTYLIDRPQLEPFHRLAEQLAQEFEPLGLRLESTGPWPPYNFANIELAESAGHGTRAARE
jgi:hypothetical protein